MNHLLLPPKTFLKLMAERNANQILADFQAEYYDAQGNYLGDTPNTYETKGPNMGA